MENQGRQSIEIENNDECCYLPEDVMFKEILPKLPTKSILGLTSVCRNWKARITGDYTFIADHTMALRDSTASHELCNIVGLVSFSPDGDKTFKLFVTVGEDNSKLVEIDMTYIKESLNKPACTFSLVGSGNGLVCLIADDDETKELVIWNPLTRELNCAPPPETRNKGESYYFGMDKVVCLEQSWNLALEDLNLRRTVYVKVLSKSTSCWRDLKSFSGFLLRGVQGQGLTLDRKMYWLICFDKEHPCYQTSPFSILCFDLCTEEFQVLHGAAFKLRRGYTFFGIIEWKGCLCVVLTNHCNTQWQFFLKANNGDRVVDSNGDNNIVNMIFGNWNTITILVPCLEPDRALGFLGDRLILATTDGLVRQLYDLTTDEVEDIEDDIGDNGFCFFQVISGHIHTLVSPR